MRKRVGLKSPVRENRTPGSVRGPSGNRRSYRDGQAQGPSARRLVARRVRQPGGGRKAVMEQDPALVTAVERLVEPTTRGDPMSPLRWTCKSTRKLAEELTGQGHSVSHTTVAQV